VSQYAIVIEGDDSTNYSAYAPDLPGVVATGDTLEECEAEMREAIAFHIEGLRLAGEPVPPATSHVATVTVAA
jgi:predicted RNase H-like HicB family nuclease